MLKNVLYDQIKLLHELSCIVWFIDKHGLKDAKEAGDEKCLEIMNEIKEEATEHIHELKQCLAKSLGKSCPKGVCPKSKGESCPECD